MEVDGIVRFAGFEVWLIGRIGKGKCDRRPGQQRRRFLLIAQRRELLAWDGIIWVARRARAWHNVYFGCVEDLIGVREDCVDRACEGRLLPDVDETPGFVPCLDLSNSDQSCLGRVELCLENEAGQEGHARDLNDGVGSKIGDRAGDSKLIFARCGLGGGGGDLLLKDTGMARLIVANFDNSLIGMWRIAGFFESGLVEGLYTELIKGKYGPLCTKEILKEKVVGPCKTFTCGEDWLRVIARKGR